MTADEAGNLAKACARSLHVPAQMEEDAIQEALLAWLTVPAWNGKGTEQGYIYQRMKWAVASFLRTHIRRTNLDTSWDASVILFPEADNTFEALGAPSEPDFAIRVELMDLLDWTFAGMTERDQEVVAMVMAGYPCMNISRRCRILGPHIKQVVARFRAILEGNDGNEEQVHSNASA